jgi:hypothetical protein
MVFVLGTFISLFCTTCDRQKPPIASHTLTPSTTVTTPPAPSILPPDRGYTVIDESKQAKFTVESKQVFQIAHLPQSSVKFNAQDLLTVLTNTRQYFRDQAAADPDISREGILGIQGVTVRDVIDTLDFTIETLEEDIANHQPIRLQDPKFISAHFQVFKWHAFHPRLTTKATQAQNSKPIRLTKYAVFSYPGSRTRSAEFNVGIYALKPGTDSDQVRLKYTKQEVLSNIYEPGGKEFGQVAPLAYLTREGLESALMEGTIRVTFADGTSAFFNVDRHNGIPFVKGLKPTEQKRYWYFQPVDHIKGYGHTIETKIPIEPGVTFAGDVLNIGLGKIVITEHTRSGEKQLQMGIIADTGGAFLPNLHQLDFLAGIFATHQEYTNYIRTLPEYTQAYILVKKR